MYLKLLSNKTKKKKTKNNHYVLTFCCSKLIYICLLSNTFLSAAFVKHAKTMKLYLYLIVNKCVLVIAKKCSALLNKSCVLLSKLNKLTRYIQKYLLKGKKCKYKKTPHIYSFIHISYLNLAIFTFIILCV